jgi:hypothetical protein
MTINIGDRRREWRASKVRAVDNPRPIDDVVRDLLDANMEAIRDRIGVAGPYGIVMEFSPCGRACVSAYNPDGRLYGDPQAWVEAWATDGGLLRSFSVSI